MRDLLNILTEAPNDTFKNSEGEEIHIRPIVSEEIEPLAGRVTGYLWARCEQAKQADDGTLMGACRTFWYGVMALEYLAVAITSAKSSGESAGIHASLAMSNNVSRAAKMIEHYVGINPTNDKSWYP